MVQRFRVQSLGGFGAGRVMVKFEGVLIQGSGLEGLGCRTYFKLKSMVVGSRCTSSLDLRLTELYIGIRVQD